MALVTLTIDGKQVSVEEGTCVLEAAKTVGIEVPSLCYLKDVNNTGSCRMCLVEVERAKTLLTACTTPVAKGMVVYTNTDKVRKARRLVLELLLSNHRTDCLTCEKNGDCKLQEYAYEYGIEDVRFGGRTEPEIEDANPFFERDLSKCILCSRCVSMCQSIQGQSAIGMIGRGFTTKVGTAHDIPLEESPCVFCGNCVQVCPVGALTPKQSKWLGRSWEIKKVETVCPYCGTGCKINLHVREGKLVGASGADGPANHELTCVKGRFGVDFVQHPDRLTVPLIKQDNGEFKEASWDEALDLVSSRLAGYVKENGPDSVATFSSAKCTNEANYIMQKFARAVLGTNNVDHCARLCHASTVAGLATAFGSGAMTNSIEEISGADVVFVTGSNTTENHPVIALQIKEALKRGAKLIVADPRKTELAQKAHVYMPQYPGTDIALFNGMMNVIIKEGLYDKEYVETRTENFDAMAKCLEKYTPEMVSEITGVPAETIIEAARVYAKAGKASIIYSMGITQHSKGTDNVLSSANLAMLTGNVGKESTGVNPLRGQNNVQGACDMGALPNVYPGYQAVTNPDLRAKFEKAWGCSLPDKVGLTIVEVVNAAFDGKVKALYIMGENPMVSDPDLNHVKEALNRLDFLVVQDIFLTETAQMAHVVLPATSFAEETGTFTSTERRVQLLEPAVDGPGQARTDWRIICDLACKMGYEMKYDSASDIMDEIASVTPSYGGMDFQRLQGDGLQWPCPNKEHPGTKYLHKDKFARGLGLFAAVEHTPPNEVPDDEYPLILTTGRMLYHFHTGSMSRRSKALDEHIPEGYIEINPETAKSLEVVEGECVQVSSRRGTLKVKAMVTPRPKVGVVFMPFHFAEAAANTLTNAALDPKAKIPEFKVCAVKVEKTGSAQACCACTGD